MTEREDEYIRLDYKKPREFDDYDYSLLMSPDYQLVGDKTRVYVRKTTKFGKVKKWALIPLDRLNELFDAEDELIELEEDEEE